MFFSEKLSAALLAVMVIGAQAVDLVGYPMGVEYYTTTQGTGSRVDSGQCNKIEGDFADRLVEFSLNMSHYTCRIFG